MTTVDPRTWTADQCETVFHNAVKAGDAKAVDAVLRLLAVRDPHRAKYLYDCLDVALSLATADDSQSSPYWREDDTETPTGTGCPPCPAGHEASLDDTTTEALR
jgi:hypothetical protein